jgi:hypothetical protein
VNEVACVFRPVVDELRARGIPSEELLHGIPVELEELGNPRRRISWDDFVELARRCSELFGPDAFEELAARSAQAALPSPFRWLLSGAGSVRNAYRVGAWFWGPRIFRATRAECEILPDGRLREVIEILPQYRESPEFFRGVRGLLRATPRLFGQLDAIVGLESDGRRGVFLIEPVPQPRLPRARLRARLKSWVQSSQIGHSGSVERFARALGRVRGWHELAGVAVRVLQRELGVRGTALSRAHPAVREHDNLAETGDRTGRPASVRALAFAHRRVGWLALWTPEGRALGEEAERRFRSLRPLLAFVVDSLRLAEANERLTQLLESSVSDWKQVETVLERIVHQPHEDFDPLVASVIPPFAGTVLLIEDDELIRRRGRRRLEAQGHAVVAVASDLSDLPLADPATGPFRLVVADWDNVELRPEALRRIARLHPTLRGVLLVPIRG